MIAVDTAVKTACDVVGIPIEQFTDPERIEENVDARGIAYKLLKDGNKWGLERIGRIWGREHSIVRWNIKRVNESLDVGGTLGELYTECFRRINAS